MVRFLLGSVVGLPHSLRRLHFGTKIALYPQGKTVPSTVLRCEATIHHHVGYYFYPTKNRPSGRLTVPPPRLERGSSAPEADALSTELWGHVAACILLRLTPCCKGVCTYPRDAFISPLPLSLRSGKALIPSLCKQQQRSTGVSVVLTCKPTARWALLEPEETLVHVIANETQRSVAISCIVREEIALSS